MNGYKGGYVYILCNESKSTLYVGVSSNLRKRIHQHREKYYRHSFTAHYNCSRLVYYSFFDGIVAAIREEKRIKGGSRLKKIKLIESMNPQWEDLWSVVKEWD